MFRSLQCAMLTSAQQVVAWDSTVRRVDFCTAFVLLQLCRMHCYLLHSNGRDGGLGNSGKPRGMHTCIRIAVNVHQIAVTVECCIVVVQLPGN